MSLYAKVAGVWKHATTAFYKIAGIWKPIRQMYIKVNGVWKQTYANNNYTIYALGLVQQLYPATNRGMWINGAYVYDPAILYDTGGVPHPLPAGGRGYNLVQFDHFGNGISFYNFDTLSDYNAGTSSEGNRMKTILDAMPNGQLFCLFSYDEPQRGHLGMNGFDLLDSVIRVGGSASVFGQPMFYRGAYILLAKVGSGAYMEAYNGDEYGDGSTGNPGTGPGGQPGDANAALVLTFSIQDNEVFHLNLMNGNGLPDYSLYALGLFQTVYPRQLAGLLQNGVQVYTLGPNWTNYLGSDIRKPGEPWPPVNGTNAPVIRSYNLVMFNADGTISVNTHGCDTYGGDVNANVAAFQAIVNAMPTGQLFALFSFDIPGGNPQLMAPIITTLGGNAAPFTAGTIPPHSAYILMGKKGVSTFYEGAAGSPETGAASDGLDGGLRKRFTIQNGNFVART